MYQDTRTYAEAENLRQRQIASYLFADLKQQHGFAWEIGQQVALRTNLFLTGVLVGELLSVEPVPGTRDVKARVGVLDGEEQGSGIAVAGPLAALATADEATALEAQYIALGHHWPDLN